jgi:hypothetical protein
VQRLLRQYSQPAEWEEKLYEVLCIRYFVKLTPAMLWYRLVKRKPYQRIQSRADLLPYFRETLISEAGHLLSAVVMLGVAVYFFGVRELLTGLLTLIVNVMINLLPICLMRYNRIRIARLYQTTTWALLAESLD